MSHQSLADLVISRTAENKKISQKHHDQFDKIDSPDEFFVPGANRSRTTAIVFNEKDDFENPQENGNGTKFQQSPPQQLSLSSTVSPQQPQQQQEHLHRSSSAASSSRRQSRTDSSRMKRKSSFLQDDHETKEITYFLEHGTQSRRSSQTSSTQLASYAFPENNDNNQSIADYSRRSPIRRSALLSRITLEENNGNTDPLSVVNPKLLADSGKFANALSNEIEALRDTSELVFTKRKQQEEILAEKRRKNGLVLKTSSDKRSNKASRDDNVSNTNTNTRSLLGGATTANSASMKNLLQRNKTQRDLLVAKKNNNRNSSKQNLSSLKRSQQTEEGDEDATLLQNQNNMSNVNFASGAFEFLKSDDGTTMLLSSEEGDDDSENENDVEQEEEEEDKSFEEQMMQAATKFDDFFWKHTVTERMTHRAILKLLITHAKRSLKKRVVKLVEKILFSSSSAFSLVDADPGSEKSNTDVAVEDPDVENSRTTSFQFANRPFLDVNLLAKNEKQEDPAAASFHKQEAPSSSLNSAIDSFIKLLDTVIFKLDKPYLDLPSISSEIILPLNKFWRDLQRCCSDLMSSEIASRETDPEQHQEKFHEKSQNKKQILISERQRNRIALHRRYVRLAREVVNILVCLTAVLQHRRRYVAKECEAAKRKQTHHSDKMRRRRSSLHQSSSVLRRRKSQTTTSDEDNEKKDENEKEDKEEEIKIPKYKHDLWLGLRFLLSTSAGVLQGESAVRQQVDSLFPGIGLDGISVQEIDVEQEHKMKLQLLREQRAAEKERERQMSLLAAQAKNDQSSNLINLKDRRRSRYAKDDDLFASDSSDDDDDGVHKYFGNKNTKNNDANESSSLSRRVTLSDAEKSAVPRPLNQQEQQETSFNPHAFLTQPRPEMVKARVGIGSHMQQVMIPLLHRSKSRKQLEAEQARFLIDRRREEDHLRVVERAFDKYLLLSRQVEMRKKMEEDGEIGTRGIPVSERLVGERSVAIFSPTNRQHRDGFSSPSIKSTSSPISGNALVTNSTRPRSIFNLPEYTTDFPKEPRRNFALTLSKGDREEEEERKRQEYLLMSTSSAAHDPGTPLFLIKDKNHASHHHYSKNRLQRRSNFSPTTTKPSTTIDPDVENTKKTTEGNDNEEVQHPDFLFMTQGLSDFQQQEQQHHRPTVTMMGSMTPEPSSSKSKSIINQRRRLSSWTPSPDSKMTSKNENRLYGNRKTRTMWGVSPSFEVAATCVSRSLQLKPML